MHITAKFEKKKLFRGHIGNPYQVTFSFHMWFWKRRLLNA